jgi:cytochrome P450 family 142 subfamily A polypeptide 1
LEDPVENKCPVKFQNIDFCAPSTHDNPYEMYDYFLEHEPIRFDETNGVWEVFRYDDIVTIERDTETFINGEGIRPNIPPDPGMIYQDGEQHSKQRALVSSGFTPRQMRKMEDRAREIVVELVGTMLQKDEVEIVEDLAGALPSRLIADMLDIPEEKRASVMSWINAIMMGGCGPEYVTDEVNEAFESFCMHHEEMYQRRMRDGCTGSDLLTIWMNAEINGEKLDESQLLFEHVLLNVGGAETTRSAIAGGLHQLSLDPKQYDALSEDPSLIPNAVEEIIRWVCPFVNMYRTATRDYEMHGKVIKEGQQVGLTYPAANRDPRKFSNPLGLVVGALGGTSVARGNDPAGQSDPNSGGQGRRIRVVVFHAWTLEVPRSARTSRLRRSPWLPKPQKKRHRTSFLAVTKGSGSS